MKIALDLIESGPLPHRHSHAAVVVDEAREAEAELSFFDYQHQSYIGESGLSPEPFFFPARKRTLADGRAGYVVGPEVTRFLRHDARFGIARREARLGDVRCKVRTYTGLVAAESAIGFGPTEKPSGQSSSSPQPPDTLTAASTPPTGAVISAAPPPDAPPPPVIEASKAPPALAERRIQYLWAAGVMLIAIIGGFLLWNRSESEQQLACAETELAVTLVKVGVLAPCARPARVDPEPAAYEAYSRCIATSQICEREACTSAYLHVAVAGEHADLVRRNQMDATALCKAQQDHAVDFVAFNRCVGDAADACARKSCVDRYRSSLDLEPYLTALRTVREASMASCDLSRDEAAYAAFNHCVARTDPCQRDSCSEPLTERVRNGTHARDITQALDDAASLCRLRDAPSTRPTQPIVNVSPSFDCSRASAPSETAICNDNQLAQLDLELADVYALRLSSLVGSARRKFVRSERDWIAYRDSSCGFSKSCLASLIQTRIKQLRRY